MATHLQYLLELVSVVSGCKLPTSSRPGLGPPPDSLTLESLSQMATTTTRVAVRSTLGKAASLLDSSLILGTCDFPLLLTYDLVPADPSHLGLPVAT